MLAWASLWSSTSPSQRAGEYETRHRYDTPPAAHFLSVRRSLPRLGGGRAMPCWAGLAPVQSGPYGPALATWWTCGPRSSPTGARQPPKSRGRGEAMRRLTSAAFVVFVLAFVL